jgi:hypothetical protein
MNGVSRIGIDEYIGMNASLVLHGQISLSDLLPGWRRRNGSA